MVGLTSAIQIAVSAPTPLTSAAYIAELDAIKASHGIAVTGKEERIRSWMVRVFRTEGVGICPETAVCFDCLETLRAAGKIAAHESVVVFNTGAVQKYPEAVAPLNLPRIEKEKPLTI